MTHVPGDLDHALLRAAAEPAYRPEFFRQLLSATVYVLGTAGADGREPRIQRWRKKDGSVVIPFFSSLAALGEAQGETAEPYLDLPARRLFEATRGTALVLNPASRAGKEFHPEEIAAILETGVNHRTAERAVATSTEVLLGQPATMPEALIAALRKFFAEQPAVQAAYLALMHDPSAGQRPNLVVGVAVEGAFDQLVRQAGAVAADTAPAGEAVDFIQVVEGETGLSEYLRTKVAPFYERPRKSRWASLFGSRTS